MRTTEHVPPSNPPPEARLVDGLDLGTGLGPELVQFEGPLPDKADLKAAADFAQSEEFKALFGEDGPEITNIAFSTSEDAAADLANEKCAAARKLLRCLSYGDISFLTFVHHEGALTPILDPNKLRTLNRDLVLALLKNTPPVHAPNCEHIGPAAFLCDHTAANVVGAFDGQFRVDDAAGTLKETSIITEPSVENPFVATTIQRIIQETIQQNDPRLLLGVGVNVLKCPPLKDLTDINPNAALLEIEGENITPAVITAIARKAYGDNPLAYFVVGNGQTRTTAAHTLPLEHISMEELQTPGKYADVIEREKDHFTGTGSASVREPISKQGHLHIESGHLRSLKGKLWVVVYPANEVFAQYE